MSLLSDPYPGSLAKIIDLLSVLIATFELMDEEYHKSFMSSSFKLESASDLEPVIWDDIVQYGFNKVILPILCRSIRYTVYSICSYG